MVGEYSTGEVRSTILNSLSDPQCPTNPSLLINLAESISIRSRSSDDIRTMADFVSSLRKRFNKRIALVVSNDLAYGLMRMSSAGSEERGIETEVFRKIDDAREWLLS
jgi:hypothetical protein